MSQDSQKYKLVKDVYSFKQDGSTVSEDYTSLREACEELDAMNKLATITTIWLMIPQIFLNSLLKQQEKLKLFQFSVWTGVSNF